jgi:glycosyltransferase involved in cell wall biosynthesis
MNLLVTATAYPPSLGGAQVLAHQVAVHLLDRHDVRVLTHWTANRTDWLLGTTVHAPASEQSYVVDGVPVRTVNVPTRGRWRLWPWVAAYWAVQGPALRRIAGALEAPLQAAAGSPDLVHNVRIGREALTVASLALARRRGVPFVLTPVHHPRWGTFVHRHYHAAYRQADAVLALTEAEKRTLVGLGVDETRIHVTGMGPVLSDVPDGRRFRERHELGDDPIVLFVGQKHAYKGLDRLLAAASRVWTVHPATRFVVLGPRTAHSRRLFGGVTDARVLERDAVNLSEKTDALAACDVLCLPSTEESFGGVFTEAWSLGKPVVGTDIPSVREVIEHGTDGLVTPPDVEALASALAGLLADPARAGEMGRQGRAKVEQRFSWPRLAALTEAVYRSLQ